MAAGYRLIEIQGLNHILEREGDGGRLELGASDETDLLSSLLAAVPRHESTGKAMPSTKMHCHGSSMYYHHPLNLNADSALTNSQGNWSAMPTCL